MRRAFGPEPLEPRHLLSVTLPGITATAPADGGALLLGPQSFAITFDQSVVDQIDSTFADLFGIAADQVLPTIVASDTNQDVEIDQINADGTTTPFLGGASVWNVQETVNTTVAPDGTIRTQLVVSLPPGSPTMTPGTYQIVVQPQSQLGAAFAAIEPNSAWATSTDPLPIAGFTVLGQGPTLAGASDLGPIGPTVQDFSGSVNPAQYQSAVALYRFSVPDGQSWQFDAKVLAQAIGSRFMPAVTLFDSYGNVLAQRSASGGSAAGSTDPELTHGLGPGTYYLGISAAGNLPGQVGGYDAISGKPGTAGTNEPAGPFQLELSATPSAPSTRLVAFNLNYADSLSPSPTTLDLTFSGNVNVSPLFLPDRQETALTVVNSSGQVWPISAVSYETSPYRLSFLFNEALPPGTYTLTAPAQGGLTDPYGQPVDGPIGNPSGVLATWTVAAPAGPSDPSNLGVLWPGLVNVTWAEAVSGTATPDAGQVADERFVVICPGYYGLQTQPGTGSVDVRVEDSNGATVAEADNLTQLNTMLLSLGPGVYYMSIVPAGSQSASVQWTLKPLSLDYEKILGNGVGQSPALGFSLISPAPSNPATSSNAASPDGASSTSTAAGPIATAAGTDGIATAAGTGGIATAAGTGATPFAAAPIPSVLLVTLETGLAGLPSPGAGSTAAFGPLADGASAALADAGRGLPPGLRFASSPSGTDPRVGEGDPADGPDAFPPPPLALGGSSQSDATADLQASGAGADAMALARADRLGRIAEWLAGRIVVMPSEPGEVDGPAAELGTTLFAAAGMTDGPAAAADPGRDRRRATLAQADLGAPFVLLVTTVLTYRLSEPIRKWRWFHHKGHPTWPRPYGFRRSASVAGGGL